MRFEEIVTEITGAAPVTITITLGMTASFRTLLHSLITPLRRFSFSADKVSGFFF